MPYNKNSGYGAALVHSIHNVIPTAGRIFVVVSASDYSDEKYQRLQECFNVDTNGKVRVFTSVEDAYDAVSSNNDDVICLDGHSAHSTAAMMTIAKNRVHFFGLGSNGRFGYQAARISMGVTGVATDLTPVLVTGVRNTFHNIKVENASTTNQSLYGFIENGEGTYIENCSFVKTAGLDDANHAHFFMSGDSLNMKNCLIGQSNVPNTAAGFGILIDGKTGGGSGGVVKENILENIYILMSVGGSVQATSAFIKIADNAAMNFGNVISNLKAVNYIPVGGTIMTDAILAAASTTSGSLHLIDPNFQGCTGVGAGSGYGVYISASGLAPVAAGGLYTTVTD
jgi:hypothetical protein